MLAILLIEVRKANKKQLIENYETRSLVKVDLFINFAEKVSAKKKKQKTSEMCRCQDDCTSAQKANDFAKQNLFHGSGVSEESHFRCLAW